MDGPNEYLESLIQQALDCHIIEQRRDLPWYNAATDEFTDEVALSLWLEDRLGVEKPTLTLNADALVGLFTDTTFRLLLTKSAVREILDKHLHIVDERIKDRISGEYTPELSTYFRSRLKDIIECEVGNFLRLRYHSITEIVNKVVDKEMQKTIDQEVRRRFDSLKKELARAADVALKGE